MLYSLIPFYITILLVEGVCVTTVILAPGVRGRWGLSHHFCTTSIASVASVASVANSKNTDFAVIYNDLALARSPNRAWHPMGLPHGPPGAQGAPNGPQRCPKTAKGTSKAGQRGPKAPQREPNSIYTNSRSTAQAAVTCFMICLSKIVVLHANKSFLNMFNVFFRFLNQKPCRTIVKLPQKASFETKMRSFGTSIALP